tara:strand:- start:256 stop:720 length:465 start_codon:yes stop_codon:yes gene_type:complete
MSFFKKINILIFIPIFLISCGYTPMYKNQKNLNFSISIIDSIGDRKINNLIKTKLKRYTLIEAEKNYKIIVNANYDKVVLAKDTTGSVTDYRLSINVTFDVKSDNFNKQLKYQENFNMKKLGDKLEELDYEKSIQNNLISLITQKFVEQLALIK